MTLKLEPLSKFPSELDALNPENAAEPIVIGSQAYKMYPLTELMIEQFSSNVMNIIGEFVESWSTATREIAERDDDGSVPEDSQEKATNALKTAGSVIMESGIITSLLSSATGLPEDQIREDMTVPQIAHVASVIYDQNFNAERYPDITRGKLTGLLGFLGVGKRGATAFAGEVINICLDPLIADRKEMTRAIFSSATRLLPSGNWSQQLLSASDGDPTLSRVGDVPSADSSEATADRTSDKDPSAAKQVASEAAPTIVPGSGTPTTGGS